jgi:hypothetical protein
MTGRLTVRDDSVTPCTDETIDVLRQLHPRRAAPVSGSLSTPELDVIPVDDSTRNVLPMPAEDITEAVKSFPAGSAGGFDGVRPQHLKDLTSRYTHILRDSDLRVMAERIPLDVRTSYVLRSHILYALAKKGEGI